MAIETRRTVTIDGVTYPLTRVSECTCGTWDHRHERDCGWEIDDRREVRR